MLLLDLPFTPAQEELRRVLHYDSLTGVWTWLVAPSNKVRAGQRAGSIDKAGYWIIRWRNKGLKAHRLAFLYMVGWMPEFVDHRHGLRSDCRWANLRAATRYDNAHNMPVSSRNKLQVKGVQARSYGRFRARIRYRGKLKVLGTYGTVAEAESAYRYAAEQLQGEFAVHKRVA